MTEHGVGIVGCGMAAEVHARAIAEIERARLVATMNPHVEKAEALARRYGATAYGDLDAFLEHRGLDVVCICTPSGAHKEPAERAAEAGKHCIVEKPLEITTARCDALIRACRDAGVALTGVFMCRFADGPQRLKRAIDAGRFGRLLVCDAYVKWYRDAAYYGSSRWKGTWRLDGGGALMNQSIHAVDLAAWFAGPVGSVQAVTARLRHPDIEVEDTALALLRYTSGALGVIEASTALYPGFARRIEVHGERGTAVLEDDEIVRWDFVDEEPEDEAIRRAVAAATVVAAGAADPASIKHVNHRRQIERFLQSLDGKAANPLPGEEARVAVAIIEAIYRSAEERRETDVA